MSDTNVIGKWRSDELIWTYADGREVSDGVLRGWCFSNLGWPWCYPGVITKLQTDAWSAAHPAMIS